MYWTSSAVSIVYKWPCTSKYGYLFMPNENYKVTGSFRHCMRMPGEFVFIRIVHKRKANVGVVCFSTHYWRCKIRRLGGSSRRNCTVGSRLRPVPWGLWWKKWLWNMFFSSYIRPSLPISFHQYIIYVYSFVIETVIQVSHSLPNPAFL